jgi:small subunit ribosomal protein S19
MPKKFSYRGYTLEDLQKMSIEEFAKIIKSRSRRMIKRGFTDKEKKLIERMRENPAKYYKTHQRDMIVLPQMVGVKLGVHNGKEWVAVDILPEMIGHRLGEFSMTTQRVKHSAPGIGASRGSKHVSIK